MSPHIFDPARLLSTRLLHSLNRSMCTAIYPQKTTTSVCLGFFLHTSSMIVGEGGFVAISGSGGKYWRPLELAGNNGVFWKWWEIIAV